MADKTNILPETTTPDAENTQWKGYTIDELRMARAKALLHREFGRLQLQNGLKSIGTRAKEGGIRGMLFNNSIVSSLNKVDYLYLAFRAAKLMTRMWLKRRR